MSAPTSIMKSDLLILAIN